MQDLRTKVKQAGVSTTWLAEQLTYKTGHRIYQPWLCNVIKGDVKSVAAACIYDMVDKYIEQLETVNQDYFAKDKIGD